MSKLQLVRDYGVQKSVQRLWYEFKKASGLLSFSFPERIEISQMSLDKWRAGNNPFTLSGKGPSDLEKKPDAKLREFANKILTGNLFAFSATWYRFDFKKDWLKNLDTNLTYEALHWTKIPSYDKAKGDIKYVWEASRFNFITHLIRDDFHNNEDHGQWIFGTIESWIDNNPLNQGPNYVCSQEISIRLLNWSFALAYYRQHEALTQTRFQKICESINGQVQHVFKNITFSRNFVRNNHAITECFMMFYAGLVFPFVRNASRLQKQGFKFLNEELMFQFADDGSYIQYSHNYHRTVVQVASMYASLCKKYQVTIPHNVKHRLEKSLAFLTAHCDIKSGELPNYGANDGALFFQLETADFRDYRPQLNTLASALDLNRPFETKTEELKWFGLTSTNFQKPQVNSIERFDDGGYYILRKEQITVFVRCGNHKHRPSQSDNLHIDVWIDGVNALWDIGSYKYNTTEAKIIQFWGTKGHNTLQLGDHNQMLKGPRFLWNYWTQRRGEVEIKDRPDGLYFTGAISAFQQIKSDIAHTREIQLESNQLRVIDCVSNAPEELSLKQHWHINPKSARSLTFELDGNSQIATSNSECSRYYGKTEESLHKIITSDTSRIETTIHFT